MTVPGPVSAAHLGLVDPRRPAPTGTAAPGPGTDPRRLRALAERAAVELAEAPATEVLRWAGETFGSRLCVTSSMVDAVVAHLARWKVPVNELLRQGYGSGGCWPCARRTTAGENPRAGRWAMFDKTECGLRT